MRTISLSVLKEADYSSNIPSVKIVIALFLTGKHDSSILQTVNADATIFNLYPTFNKDILPLESTIWSM